MSEKRIAIVGGGVGGYPAAIRAARLGAKVVLVEKDLLGGTCLNWGCIPTKVMLHATELYEKVRGGASFGLTGGDRLGIDMPALLKRKKQTVANLTNGVQALLRARKIEVAMGTACFEDERRLKILETDKKIDFDAAVIASGSVPALPPIAGIDRAGVLTSKEALELGKAPAELVIIGGGVIGVEFAQIFHRLGTKVVILEMLDKLLGQEDRELSEVLEKKLTSAGIAVHTNVRVTKIAAGGQKGRMTVHYLDDKDHSFTLQADRVLSAAGRSPCVEGLALDRIGVETEKGAVRVDGRMETTCKGIYAAGDCVGGLMLAHLATEEGETAAKNALGQDRKMQYGAVPRCIYTDPQIAACGLTEEEASASADIRVARFPLMASGKASILGETYGLIKIIAEKRLDQVLGVLIAGPAATELIGVACLGMKMEMTAEELAGTIFAHPTLSEVYRECASQLGEGPIHLP